LGNTTGLASKVRASMKELFYVLLEDDRLITHVAVTSDTLLEQQTLCAQTRTRKISLVRAYWIPIRSPHVLLLRAPNPESV